MQYYFAFVSAIFGLIIGSFLNVVIYRVPRGESIVTPGSHCPVCNHALGPLDLIPVLSFLWQKRRCRYCASPISWRYAGVELLTALLFLLAFWQNYSVFDLNLIFKFIYISFLIALSFIDYDTYRLPDVLVFPLLAVGLLSTLQPGGLVWWKSIAGAVGAGALFFIIAWLYPKGMGWGDVKFVAALGSFLGFPSVFFAIFIASLLGVLTGGIMTLGKKFNVKQQIPFGPFLSAGALIVLLWGNQLIQFYFNLLPY